MSGKEAVGRYLWKGLFLTAFLAFLVSAAGNSNFGDAAGTLLFQEVFAAPQEPLQTERIEFTNRSGNYLEYTNGKFHLYNRAGAPLTGPQYLKIPRVHGIFSGYYMFDKTGTLLQKEAVYCIKNRKTGNLTFHGYYVTSVIGRFVKNERGLQYLPGYKCGSLNFKGYFYVGEYGKLSCAEGVRDLKAKKVKGTRFIAGYYFFNPYGRLYNNAGFHAFKGKVNTQTFNGTYYFGGSNGSLYKKAGWITSGGWNHSEKHEAAGWFLCGQRRAEMPKRGDDAESAEKTA